MITEKEKRFLQHLAQFPSDHKKEFIESVLNNRTRYVTVVFENMYQAQNTSAAIRTAECLGLQDIHIIEHTTRYSYNLRVLKGAAKWVTVHRHRLAANSDTDSPLVNLRNAGYRLYGADPAPDGIPVDDIPIDQPLAVVFGNELHGLSAESKQACDGTLCIPMYGFTESMNVSVSAALALQSILTRLRKSTLRYHLTDEEKDQLRLDWYKKVVRRSDLLEREFMRTIA